MLLGPRSLPLGFLWDLISTALSKVVVQRVLQKLFMQVLSFRTREVSFDMTPNKENLPGRTWILRNWTMGHS